MTIKKWSFLSCLPTQHVKTPFLYDFMHSPLASLITDLWSGLVWLCTEVPMLFISLPFTFSLYTWL